MNKSISDNILRESVDNIKKILGDEFYSLSVDRAVIGLFFSGVKISSGHGGICFTPIKEIPQAVCCPSSAAAMPISGKLSGRSVSDYIDDIFKKNILRKVLGIATLNAMSALYWDRVGRKDYELIEGIDAFDEVELVKGNKVVVVGALTPILKRLIREGIDFKVLEMDPSTLKEHEMEFYAPPSESRKYIPDADIVIITGTTLINNTLEGLLSLTKKNAKVIVTGPTASMLPEAFFKRGVTTLGGVIVTKPDEVLNVISEGGSGYHFFGKSAERLVIRSR